MKKICFIGASTVEGVGDDTGQGWTSRLVAKKLAQGNPVVPYYLGVRGQTLAQISSRAKYECQVRITSIDNDLIVLGTGVNDISRIDGKPRTDRLETIEIFSRLISELKLLCRLIVVGPLPVYEPKMPFYSAVNDLYLDYKNEDITLMSKEYAEICASEDTPYIDVFNMLLTNSDYHHGLKTNDGLHSDTDGYEAVSECIENWEGWRKLTK